MDLKKTVTDSLHSSPFPPSGLLKPVTGQVTQAVTNPSLDPFFGICMACHQNRILNNECKQYTGRRCGVADHTRLGSRLDQLQDMASPSMTHHPPP